MQAYKLVDNSICWADGDICVNDTVEKYCKPGQIENPQGECRERINANVFCCAAGALLAGHGCTGESANRVAKGICVGLVACYASSLVIRDTLRRKQSFSLSRLSLESKFCTQPELQKL